MEASEANAKKAREPMKVLLLLYGNFLVPYFLPTMSAKPAKQMMLI
jgi:hypothetical protein